MTIISVAGRAVLGAECHDDAPYHLPRPTHVQFPICIVCGPGKAPFEAA